MKKGRLIIASSESCADILYASGFNAPDPFIYFSCGREKGIIVSTLEYDRAVNQCRNGLKVYNRNEFSSGDKVPETGELLVDLTWNKAVNQWLVPGDFPLKYADFLRASGIEVKPERGCFFPKRYRKKSRELKAIREVQGLTHQAMALVRDILAEAKIDSQNRLRWQGRFLTSEILRSNIEVFLKSKGCSTSGTITAGGIQAAEPHNQGQGGLTAGETIIVDIFPRHDTSGYWGDMTRTFVKGKAPQIVKDAYQAVFEAKEEAKKYIEVGAIPSDVHKIADDILNKHGFKTGVKDGWNFGFIHGLGHGVGLEIHEYPRLSPLNSVPLEIGNVVTVEPGVYYHEWGGVRLEDMVAVKEEGYECFKEFECILEVP
jgi:Xaa-Pro aminopeptidase